MDCKYALLFLCAFIAQTACKPVERSWPVNETIKNMMEEVKSVLKILEDEAEPLPNQSSPSQNLTSLASFRCCIVEVSANTPELESRLKGISHYIQMVEKTSGKASNCSLPCSPGDEDEYLYIRRLLQDLAQWVRATFNIAD